MYHLKEHQEQKDFKLGKKHILLGNQFISLFLNCIQKKYMTTQKFQDFLKTYNNLG